MSTRTIHRRTSQITDPPTGKFPPRTEASIAASRDLAEHRRMHPADTWEDRPLGERCLSFGAPRLGSGYNSYWQIVQSAETVAIIQEMAHDVRIVPIVPKPHLDESVKLWHGDSRGWWEGDTLVVETTNYSEASSTSPRTVDKVNIERLTRISETALQYQFNKPLAVGILREMPRIRNGIKGRIHLLRPLAAPILNEDVICASPNEMTAFVPLQKCFVVHLSLIHI